MTSRRIAVASGVATATAAALAAASSPAAAARPGFAPRPPAVTTTTLVTNEYAYWNQDEDDAVRSAHWRADSGSLFARPTADGVTYWTGGIDDGEPDADSDPDTNSAVFRLASQRADLRNVAVSTRVRVNGMTTTASTPAVDWDGVSLVLRQRGDSHLYLVNVARRDGALSIKKKCPDGSFHVLAEKAGHAATVGAWSRYAATAQTRRDGDVRLTASHDGSQVASVVDTGTGCEPLTARGRVGVWGDNTDFDFQQFRAWTTR